MLSGTKFTAVFLVLAVGIFLVWVSPAHAATQTAPEASKSLVRAQQEIGRLPAKMPGSENDTPALIELGR